MALHAIDIYLVPVGSQGYELYCETDDAADQVPDSAAAPSGWRGRLSQMFQQSITYIENERHRRHEREQAQLRRSWLQRIRDRIMAWIAERVAEQRLLWNLRHVDAATLHHPHDLDETQTEQIVMASLRRDARRHLFWLVINAHGYLAALPITPFPGPNVLAYYFVFRAGGHFLAAMGARHGLKKTAWRYVVCPALTELRNCRTLAPVARDALAHDVATRLKLRHLAPFVERMTSVRP